MQYANLNMRLKRWILLGLLLLTSGLLVPLVILNPGIQFVTIVDNLQATRNNLEHSVIAMIAPVYILFMFMFRSIYHGQKLAYLFMLLGFLALLTLVIYYPVYLIIPRSQLLTIAYAYGYLSFLMLPAMVLVVLAALISLLKQNPTNRSLKIRLLIVAAIGLYLALDRTVNTVIQTPPGTNIFAPRFGINYSLVYFVNFLLVAASLLAITGVFTKRFMGLLGKFIKSLLYVLPVLAVLIHLEWLSALKVSGQFLYVQVIVKYLLVLSGLLLIVASSLYAWTYYEELSRSDH